jgi:cytoskeletal protein CcmA (bactofilin family)
MLKAASLIYAIFISLIIGILCYSVLLLFSLNLNLDNHFELRQKLLSNNSSGIAYAMAQYGGVHALQEVAMFPEEHTIVTHFTVSPWGIFKKVSVISISKRDSVRQDVLMGDRHIKKAPAIYLRDNDEQFKIAGTTEIIGDIFISSRGIKKVTITGNSEINNPIHTGKIHLSEKILPLVSPPILEYPDDFQSLRLNEILESLVINTFDNKTQVIEATTALENIRLKGNIIVRSKDTLTISSSAVLEDIIIEAPKVIFEDGFRGNVQVFASKEIIIKSDVHLQYPTALIVASQADIEKVIHCGENSTVNGVVLLFGNGLATESKNKIIIDPKSTIRGDIFCDGKLFLYGTVKGSVFASQFSHKTQTTNYDNIVFNGKVIPGKLPEAFFQFPLLDKFESDEPIIIKKL